VVVFIVVPKNSGLKKYREIALSSLSDPSNLLEVRGEDVAFWVEQLKEKGKKALGLTGQDLYKEYCLENREIDLKVLKIIPWEDKTALFNKPALCLLGPKSKDLASLKKSLTVCIASKYKKIAKKYLNFLERKGFSFQKIYANGSIEATYDQGISDLVIDIVYSGSTMKKYNLKVLEKILESDFVIIGGKND
jgi:ATP phosphoribosyltransferase|tara:strand:- start:346 stop:921 length:576 start_codon:yes stop_codon:yes gene_type:complete